MLVLLFLPLFSFFFGTVRFNCLAVAHILIRSSECLTTNKLSLNLTCSKRLYRFKVFLDPRRAHQSDAVLLQVRQRKFTDSVFLLR